jgi:hypothetical protein
VGPAGHRSGPANAVMPERGQRDRSLRSGSRQLISNTSRHSRKGRPMPNAVLELSFRSQAASKEFARAQTEQGTDKRDINRK